MGRGIKEDLRTIARTAWDLHSGVLSYLSNRRFVSKIYKEIKKINKKTTLQRVRIEQTSKEVEIPNT